MGPFVCRKISLYHRLFLNGSRKLMFIMAIWVIIWQPQLSIMLEKYKDPKKSFVLMHCSLQGLAWFWLTALKNSQFRIKWATHIEIYFTIWILQRERWKPKKLSHRSIYPSLKSPIESFKCMKIHILHIYSCFDPTFIREWIRTMPIILI